MFGPQPVHQLPVSAHGGVMEREGDVFPVAVDGEPFAETTVKLLRPFRRARSVLITKYGANRGRDREQHFFRPVYALHKPRRLHSVEEPARFGVVTQVAKELPAHRFGKREAHQLRHQGLVADIGQDFGSQVLLDADRSYPDIFGAGQCHPDQRDPAPDRLVQALGARPVEWRAHGLGKLDDLVDSEEQLLGLDDVDLHHSGGQRFNGMVPSTAHVKMKVAVAFDQTYQLRQDSLVADVVKIVDY